jgi:hypothetical protein
LPDPHGHITKLDENRPPADNRNLKQCTLSPVHLIRSLREYAPAGDGAPPLPPKLAAA